MLPSVCLDLHPQEHLFLFARKSEIYQALFPEIEAELEKSDG